MGSDRLNEAILDSLGDVGEYQVGLDAAFRLKKSHDRELELNGHTRSDKVRHTIDGDIDTINRTNFAIINQVRDGLAALAEATLIYETVKQSVPEDSTVLQLRDIFTSSLEARFFVIASARISEAPISDAWEYMASAIVMICSDPDDLANFQEFTKRANVDLSAARALVRRARAAAMKSRSR